MTKRVSSLLLFSFLSINTIAQPISAIIRTLARAEKKFAQEGENADHAVFRKYSTYLNANQAHLLAHCYFAEFCNREVNGTQKAWYFLKCAAQGGNACAQVNLADLYERGVDVKKDFTQAMRWYENALHTNHPEIQFIVGTKYLEGKVTPKNVQKCIQLYQRASEKNHIKASIALGFIFNYGIGVTKNDSIANVYFSKAERDTTQHYNIFAREIYLQQNTINLQIQDVSIWFPNEYGMNEIIVAQLQQITNRLKLHPGKFQIHTNGNGSYDEQYLSWMKSTNLIKYMMNVINLPKQNLIMSYGQGGNLQTANIHFADEISEGPTLTPPPASSLLNHRYDICGHSHFSP